MTKLRTMLSINIASRSMNYSGREIVARTAENVWRSLAFRLPRPLAYWATVHAIVRAAGDHKAPDALSVKEIMEANEDRGAMSASSPGE